MGNHIRVSDFEDPILKYVNSPKLNYNFLFYLKHKSSFFF